MTAAITLEKFLAHPTKVEWYDELSVHGWPGPNGSSWSFDDISGVPVSIYARRGEDNPLLWVPEYEMLAADRHDWRYQLGRRLRLPESYRKAADEGYRDDCLRHVGAALVGRHLWLAERKCRARYAGLRMFGRFAWTTS